MELISVIHLGQGKVENCTRKTPRMTMPVVGEEQEKAGLGMRVQTAPIQHPHQLDASAHAAASPATLTQAAVPAEAAASTDCCGSLQGAAKRKTVVLCCQAHHAKSQPLWPERAPSVKVARVNASNGDSWG